MGGTKCFNWEDVCNFKKIFAMKLAVEEVLEPNMMSPRLKSTAGSSLMKKLHDKSETVLPMSDASLVKISRQDFPVSIGKRKRPGVPGET